MPAATREPRAPTKRASTSPQPKKKAARRRNATGVQLGEDEVRSRILQAGAMVFAQSGVRAASVEDILLVSGISRRTFYRFYEGKEDVMLALYNLGTEGLLGACRFAVASTHDPLLRFERCIDAHLQNARGLARLIFVLGGEAQHHESPLYVRRREVHDQLVQLLAHAPGMPALDELMVRAMILALEGVVRFMLEQGDEGRSVSSSELARAKKMLLQLCSGALA
ncbi:MAG: TetR/AcrR family transcriptional regulator [Myxococcales bacterium]